MKRVFIIDWLLIPLFVFSAYTGIELHSAGYGNNHELWHNWSVAHVLTSFLFLITTIFHIITHWGWYKSLIKNGIGKKSKVTVVLSIIFLLVSVTGIILLGVNGANSVIGLWHYRIGLATMVLSVGHILKRSHLLHKSLKKTIRSKTVFELFFMV